MAPASEPARRLPGDGLDQLGRILFELRDGEKIVTVTSFDPKTPAASIAEDPKNSEACPLLHGLTATSSSILPV